MLNFGFYDSVDGDRTYNAESMSRLFDGIIRDGVFGTVGDHFALSLGGGLRVRVGSGRAWFNGTWTDLRPANSDDNLEFELTYNSDGPTRYDHIVLVVDKRAMSRKNEIKVFEGSWPNDSTQWPTDVYYYRLGYVDVGPGVTALTYASLHTRVGFDDPAAGGVPFVTGPLETISIDDLVDEWEAEINDKIDAAIEDYFGGGAGIQFAKTPQDIGNGFAISASAGTAKTAIITDYKLVRFGRISIYFYYAVPANSTLNINSLGAKPIYYGVSPITDGIIPAHSIATFVYDVVDNGRYYLTALDVGGTGGTSRFVTRITNSGGIYSSTETYSDIIAAATRYDIVIADTPDGIGYYVEDDSGAIFNVSGKTPNGSLNMIRYKVSSGGVTRTSSLSYQKPSSGIPLTDLASDVRQSIINGDAAYQLPSGGIPETDLDSSVQAKLNSSSGATFIHISLFNGDYYTDVTSAEIYTALQYGDVNYVAIDPNGRECFLVSAPTNATTSPAIFATINSQGTGIIVYSFAEGDVDGVNRQQVNIPSAPTWNDIKPPGGVPASDLASDAKPFDIVCGISNNNPVCNRLFSDIVSAKSSGAVLRPIFDDFEGIVSHIDTVEAQFWFIDDTGGSPTWYIFTVDDTNTVTVGTTIMGDAMNPTVFTNASATPSSLMAQANYIYKFTAAAITSLTVTVVPANGDTCIEFNSGSTPTTLTLPASVHMPDGFTTPEANKHYEISFHNGYAVVASWAVSA